MALIPDTLPKVQELLMPVEIAFNKVGIFLNANKTKYISMNDNEDHSLVTMLDIKAIKEKDDFMYLDSHITGNKNDFLASLDICNRL